MTISKQIAAHLEAATGLALAEVERRARKILATHSNLNEFIMGMGTWYFTDNQGELIYNERAYFKSLGKFIHDWDDNLGLTGTPMRFTAAGQKITDW